MLLDLNDLFNGDFLLLIEDMLLSDFDDLVLIVVGIELIVYLGWGMFLIVDWDINNMYIVKFIISYCSLEYEGGFDDDVVVFNLFEFFEEGGVD